MNWKAVKPHEMLGLSKEEFYRFIIDKVSDEWISIYARAKERGVILSDGDLALCKRFFTKYDMNNKFDTAKEKGFNQSQQRLRTSLQTLSIRHLARICHGRDRARYRFTRRVVILPSYPLFHSKRYILPIFQKIVLEKVGRYWKKPYLCTEIKRYDSFYAGFRTVLPIADVSQSQETSAL